MKYSNSFTKIFLIIISIIFLTSCKTFQLVEKYELVSPLGIKVKPEINWNQVQHSNNQFGWTIDGPVLNEILFISADENVTNRMVTFNSKGNNSKVTIFYHKLGVDTSLHLDFILDEEEYKIKVNPQNKNEFKNI